VRVGLVAGVVFGCVCVCKFVSVRMAVSDKLI
jgi:hypothetical protein